MTTTKFIDRKQEIQPAQQFRTLLEEAVALAKAYSGEIWTDYNDHDPGVTILEQLCYAIAELAYQAELGKEYWLFGRADTSAEDLFLFRQGEELELDRPSITEMPGYYSMTKTFPANYGLQATLPTEGPQKQQQIQLRTYISLLESLLVDFHLRLRNFSALLKSAAKGESANLGEKFGESFKGLLDELKVAEQAVTDIAGAYNTTAFTLDNKIAFQEYLLRRYGEVYDKETKERLQLLYGLENEEKFKGKWLAVLKNLVKNYQAYAGKGKLDFFTTLVKEGFWKTAMADGFGVLKKLEILLSPMDDKAKSYFIAKVEPNELKLAVILAFNSTEEIKEKQENILALIKQLFPFYALPKLYFLGAEGADGLEIENFDLIFSQDEFTFFEPSRFEALFFAASNETATREEKE